jgi:hypothetical protein
LQCPLTLGENGHQLHKADVPTLMQPARFLSSGCFLIKVVHINRSDWLLIKPAMPAKLRAFSCLKFGYA